MALVGGVWSASRSLPLLPPVPNEQVAWWVSVQVWTRQVSFSWPQEFLMYSMYMRRAGELIPYSSSAMGWSFNESGYNYEQGEEIFSSPWYPYQHGAHTDSCTMRTRVSFPRGRAAGAWSCCPPTSHAEAKNQTNSFAFTDWATATSWRNLVPTFMDRGVSRCQRSGSPMVVNFSFLDWRQRMLELYFRFPAVLAVWWLIN
jgi:hypothetical protein